MKLLLILPALALAGRSIFCLFASAPKCRGAVLEATMIGDGGTFHAHAQ